MRAHAHTHCTFACFFSDVLALFVRVCECECVWVCGVLGAHTMYNDLFSTLHLCVRDRDYRWGVVVVAVVVLARTSDVKSWEMRCLAAICVHASVARIGATTPIPGVLRCSNQAQSVNATLVWEWVFSVILIGPIARTRSGAGGRCRVGVGVGVNSTEVVHMHIEIVMFSLRWDRIIHYASMF